jgi:hypothetical protein
MCLLPIMEGILMPVFADEVGSIGDADGRMCTVLDEACVNSMVTWRRALLGLRTREPSRARPLTYEDLQKTQ